MNILCRDCSCDVNKYSNRNIPLTMLCDPLNPSTQNALRARKRYDEFYDRNKPMSVLNYFRRKLNRVISRNNKERNRSRLPNYGGSNFELNKNFNHQPSYYYDMRQFQKVSDSIFKDQLKRKSGSCINLDFPSSNNEPKHSVLDATSESQKPRIVSRKASTSRLASNDSSGITIKAKDNKDVLIAIKDLYSLINEKFQKNPESCACRCKESILKKIETIKEIIQQTTNTNCSHAPSVSKLTTLQDEIYELKTDLLELKLQNADMRMKTQYLPRIDQSVSTNHCDLKPKKLRKQFIAQRTVEQSSIKSSNSSRCNIFPNISPTSFSSAFNNGFNSNSNGYKKSESIKCKFSKKKTRNKTSQKSTNRKTSTNTATALPNRRMTKHQYTSMKTEFSKENENSSIQSLQNSDEQNYNHNHNEIDDESSPKTKDDLEKLVRIKRSKKKCSLLYKSNKEMSFIANLNKKPPTTELLSFSANTTTHIQASKEKHVSKKSKSPFDTSISSIQSLYTPCNQNLNHNHNPSTNRTVSGNFFENNADHSSESDNFQMKNVCKLLSQIPQKLETDPTLSIENILKEFNANQEDDQQKSKSRVSQRNFVSTIMKDSFPEDYTKPSRAFTFSPTYNQTPEPIENSEEKDNFSTQNKKHRLPIHPYDIEAGDLVRFTRNGSKICIGIVRYIGDLPFQKETFLGIELETDDGLHDGVYYGQRYFKCPNMRGIFVSFQRILMVFK